MLLTLTTTFQPATDLGYLLHKHPERVQSVDLPLGQAHVFYPEATPERCTVALLVEVDPVALVRGRRNAASESFSLTQFVNDRPYAASSLLSSALTKVFRSAMGGRCDARPGLADASLPLEVRVPALPCRGGADLAGRLFAPLGWSVTADPIPLDPTIEWGDSPYVDLRLRGELRLADALNHLYVLLPVLDDAKHYWVDEAEVEKLLRAGATWLGTHPERDLVTARYLKHQGSLVGTAVERLAELDHTEPQSLDPLEGADERAVPLAAQRRAAVVEALRAAGARRVVDLGCGEGALVRDLLDDPAVTDIVGVDVSDRALALAARRLHLDTMPDRRRERVTLLQSSLSYRDTRLAGYDAAVLMEVLEHIDPPRLAAVARTVLGAARPRTIVVTTPNREHNVRFRDLPAGAMRHRDHRFEWTRAEFAAWVEDAASTYGYTAVLAGIGPDDGEVGPPTQLAVLTRTGSAP